MGIKILKPFAYYSARTLLLVGVFAYVLSSLIAYYSGYHFEGLISVKSGANSSLLLSFYNNGISILLLTVCCYLFAKLRNSHSRIIDVLNVVLISRISIYIIMLMLTEPVFIKQTLIKVELAILDNDFMLSSLTTLNKVALMSLGVLSIFALISFFYYLVSGVLFIINSKTKMDVFFVLLLIFGLEIVFVLFRINIS